MKALRVHQISVNRGSCPVLDQISLCIEPGEVLALVGPNGAGKSTLIKAVLGLVPSWAGSVFLGDQNLGDLSVQQKARQLAYLPQDRDVAWSICGADLVALGRFAWGSATYDRLSDPDRQAVDEALDRMDVMHLRARSVQTLSGGERARLHLARALATRAPFLLVDEPTAALDPRHQLEAMDVLQAEARRGVGVVCALHDLEAALRFADRVAVIDSGRLVVVDTPQTALDEARLAAVFGVQMRKSDGFEVLTNT